MQRSLLAGAKCQCASRECAYLAYHLRERIPCSPEVLTGWIKMPSICTDPKLTHDLKIKFVTLYRDDRTGRGPMRELSRKFPQAVCEAKVIFGNNLPAVPIHLNPVKTSSYCIPSLSAIAFIIFEETFHK